MWMARQAASKAVGCFWRLERVAQTEADSVPARTPLVAHFVLAPGDSVANLRGDAAAAYAAVAADPAAELV
jgi:hypothetical protein